VDVGGVEEVIDVWLTTLTVIFKKFNERVE